MELKPRDPPGDARRKLRGLVSEIARLRAAGYTIRAIHETLVDAGIEVGWATVQREIARLEYRTVVSSASRQTPAQSVAAVETNVVAQSAAVDVNDYFDQQITNPLFRKRGKK